jgi:choline dehydrogenase-like flavoprotein
MLDAYIARGLYTCALKEPICFLASRMRERERAILLRERGREQISLYMHVVYAFICASRMSENERVFSDMFMLGQSNALGCRCARTSQ